MTDWRGTIPPFVFCNISGSYRRIVTNFCYYPDRQFDTYILFRGKLTSSDRSTVNDVRIVLYFRFFFCKGKGFAVFKIKSIGFHQMVKNEHVYQTVITELKHFVNYGNRGIIHQNNKKKSKNPEYRVAIKNVPNLRPTLPRGCIICVLKFGGRNAATYFY